MANKTGSGSIVVNAVHEHSDDKGGIQHSTDALAVGRARLAADGDVVGRSVETISRLQRRLLTIVECVCRF